MATKSPHNCVPRGQNDRTACRTVVSNADVLPRRLTPSCPLLGAPNAFARRRTALPERRLSRLRRLFAHCEMHGGDQGKSANVLIPPSWWLTHGPELERDAALDTASQRTIAVA